MLYLLNNKPSEAVADQDERSSLLLLRLSDKEKAGAASLACVEEEMHHIHLIVAGAGAALPAIAVRTPAGLCSHADLSSQIRSCT